ncbi:hypothetical protein [Streptomyces sp. NPDC017993]|uniref:hypothetical protein n=1 Tax=Streptomyces sp. NPDC017993 TaxID=3365027 RepID=UPI0037AFFF88
MTDSQHHQTSRFVVMSRPQTQGVFRARPVAYLCAALPDLDADAAEQALVAVNAHRHVGLRRLDHHLAIRLAW